MYEVVWLATKVWVIIPFQMRFIRQLNRLVNFLQGQSECSLMFRGKVGSGVV